MAYLGFLQQSATGVSVRVGPLVDSTGAVLTAGTIAVTNFYIAKGSGALVQKTGSGATLDRNGEYLLPVSSTDLNTTGRLIIECEVAGALPWRGDITVLDPGVFDAFISGLVGLPAELTAAGIAALDPQIQDSVNTVSVPPTAKGTVAGVALNTPSAGFTTITLDAGAVAGTNRYYGQTLFIDTGLGIGEARPIRSQIGLAVVVDSFNETPTTASTYVVDWGSQSVLPVDIANISRLDATISSVVARLPTTLSAGGFIRASIEAVTAGILAQAAFNADMDVYTAKILPVDDNVNNLDRWIVDWYKNGAPVVTGITVPTIQIVKVADGTNLLAATPMTQIGTTGAYRFDSSARMLDGVAYLGIVTATIGGASRLARQPVGFKS
jgi:hypothetical protein